MLYSLGYGTFRNFEIKYFCHTGHCFSSFPQNVCSAITGHHQLLLLLQNFIAEAAAPGQAAPQATVQNPMEPVDQGYNSYSGHGSIYEAGPPANAGPLAHLGGGYGSAYGTNYGY